MKTKYHIITGGESREVPTTDIKNWDEIEFTLERKDYSGVMRSFSSEFKFVGAAFRLLRDLYLADGFLAVAEVAVSTKNNDWTYTEQFRCPLDFSTLEIENGVLTINAIDNTLAGLLKSKKGQKYQFPVEEFNLTNVEIGRMAFANSAKYTITRIAWQNDTYVQAVLDEDASLIISQDYVSPASSVGQRHFATINIAPSPLIRIAFEGYVRKTFSAVRYNSVGTLQLGYWVDDENPHYQQWYSFCDDDISHELRYGSVRNKWIGKSTHANYATLDALKAAAAAHTDIIGLYPGYFGIVGSNQYPNEAYWTGNSIYEYNGSTWRNAGSPANYAKLEYVSASASFSNLATNNYPCIKSINGITAGGTMTMTWTDPANATITAGGITPAELLQRLVESISEGSTSAISEDAVGLLADTYIIPAEILRRIGGAKISTTFQQFADWMEAVFGYTYRVVGNEVQFVHRSAVFDTSSTKVIDSVRDVKYSVSEGLIYTEVDAGYSKKEYGEINGRLEKNFTNYYSTGFNSTDKKLSLISKYRADSYGIEFTIRKGEKENETKDDKNDEDVFFLRATVDSDVLKYTASKNDAYNPAVCVANNAAYIAALGNGNAVTLEMTSSDGNNALADITIAANTALFTAGKLEFTTDDMIPPVDWDGLISVDHDGYRFRGFISKANARYGRQNGMEYELIIKDITKI